MIYHWVKKRCRFFLYILFKESSHIWPTDEGKKWEGSHTQMPHVGNITYIHFPLNVAIFECGHFLSNVSKYSVHSVHLGYAFPIDATFCESPTRNGAQKPILNGVFTISPTYYICRCSEMTQSHLFLREILRTPQARSGTPQPPGVPGLGSAPAGGTWRLNPTCGFSGRWLLARATQEKRIFLRKGQDFLLGALMKSRGGTVFKVRYFFIHVVLVE